MARCSERRTSPEAGAGDDPGRRPMDEGQLVEIAAVAVRPHK
jgi:hypothetical protein